MGELLRTNNIEKHKSKKNGAKTTMMIGTQNAAKRRTNPTPRNWDIGLAILEAHARPGIGFNYREIADAVGVSDVAVQQLTERALMRVRHLLRKVEAEL
jgi:hypothetical protein